MAHQYAVGTPEEDLEFIELWDIGGCNAHREAVTVYFENVSGVIFVHDLSNSKSEENLEQWSYIFNNYRAVQSNQSMNRLSAEYSSPFCDVERTGAVPTLIVGKCYFLKKVKLEIRLVFLYFCINTNVGCV